MKNKEKVLKVVEDYINSAYESDGATTRKIFDDDAKVTGSISHGSAYWDIFWQEIIAGHGELSLGFLNDGRLATGTLVIDAEETTYYASGVYDRELFDKPLGHFPVFDSIVRSKSRGLKTYDLGEIFPAGGSSEKEGQIGFFKKSITSTTV